MLMSKNTNLQVVKSFDSSTNYGVHLPKGFKRVYEDLKEGQVIVGKEFIMNQMPKYTKSKNAHTLSVYGWRILRTGRDWDSKKTK